MFADSLCDSAWTNRSHRAWTTLASFALQTLAIAGLLVLPFLYTQGFPPLRLIGRDLIAPPAAPQAAAQPPRTGAASVSNMRVRSLIAPATIPNLIQIPNQPEVPQPPELPPGFGVRGGTGDSGTPNSVFGSIGDGVNAVALPPPPPPVTRQPRLSRMMEGNLIYRVQPLYPLLARQARIQGTVLLQAVISREGTIRNLQVLSGHPMLVQSAIDAVRQWRYRPYFLNDQPVEVETQVTVIFVLSGG